jgi:GPH family glycoside/pentoside/hexuronide:cation symporter
MLMGFAIIPVFFLPKLARKFGKRNMMIAGQTLCLTGYVINLIFAKTVISALLVSSGIVGLGFGFSALLFVMISDSVIYGEYKTGMRSEGLLSAGASFGQKLGTSIGGFVGAGLLSLGLYDGTLAVQPDSAMGMISVNYLVVPVIATAVMIAVWFFYKLDKKLPEITGVVMKNREGAKND